MLSTHDLPCRSIQYLAERKFAQDTTTPTFQSYAGHGDKTSVDTSNDSTLSLLHALLFHLLYLIEVSSFCEETVPARP
jgi:hypothetical protein